MVPLSFGSAFEFSGEEFVLGKCHALYWPRENALLVADLHLEKGSFYAQHGQMVPPYDSRETLERIAEALRKTGARRVFTLGDNFHDNKGAARLEPHARDMLDGLTTTTEWVWITGNHDPDLPSEIGGHIVPELKVRGILLRHEARKGERQPEISGHFHPRLTLKIRQRPIRRPCAVRASTKNGVGGRMILPAFGAYTGGMDAAAPEILEALQPAHAVEALIATRQRLVNFPLQSNQRSAKGTPIDETNRSLWHKPAIATR